MPLPLEGIRVLDFTRVLAGPHATRMLCDLGAEVIKVEPPVGDITRFTRPRINGVATYYAQQNVGKRNVSIDLSAPGATDLVADLADRCDVLIENFRPGVMDKLGLGPAVLRARNPGLVYVSINGYGSTGPLRHKMAYNVVISAEAGLTKFQGDARGGVYESDPSDHADVYSALEAATAVLAALVRRERTGTGDWVEVSMAHTMLYVNDHLHDQLFDGDVEPGTIRSFGTPQYVVLEVASGERMAVSGHPAESGSFEYFVRALELDGLGDDPRFGTVADRLEHFAELRAIVAEAALRIPDSATFERRFANHRLASGVVQSARALADSEWARHRGVIRSIPDRSGGEIRVPTGPWQFADATPDGPTGSGGSAGDIVSHRGEDNRAVLSDVLGLDEATIDDLEDRGVLSSRAPRV
ncbi:CaiB/BaiF CoA transferase family protein [Desertimonas flava]|uniref:CaiB/BaiF CoA transferase family protein n=1 Tax=Desertimonas flava TaxID=2064846 RepID=UPI0013C449FE|nr:CoA transferase [Desertimonas flava]